MYTQPISVYQVNPLEEILTVVGEWVGTSTPPTKLTHEDIPVFSFPPLEEVKKEFLQAGYSGEEVESITAGLSELPEYATSKVNKTRREKNQK